MIDLVVFIFFSQWQHSLVMLTTKLYIEGFFSMCCCTQCTRKPEENQMDFTKSKGPLEYIYIELKKVEMKHTQIFSFNFHNFIKCIHFCRIYLFTKQNFGLKPKNVLKILTIWSRVSPHDFLFSPTHLKYFQQKLYNHATKYIFL